MSGGSAIGTGVSVFAQLKQGDIEVRAAQTEAAIKDRQADEVIARASVNVRLAKLSGQKVKGSQIAAFAKGGVDVGGGSPLLVLEQTSMEIEREVQSIKREATFEARQLRTSADFARKQSRDIKKASELAAAATLMGGTANSSQFKSLDTSGGKPSTRGTTSARSTSAQQTHQSTTPVGRGQIA